MEKVRRASHAGSWYTDNPKKLSEEIEGWLRASGLNKSPDVRGVIAPHAGYSYSGRAAAYAFGNIDPTNIKRVFLLGPSHHHYTPKCALSTATVYKTPIGDLPIDLEGIYYFPVSFCDGFLKDVYKRQLEDAQELFDIAADKFQEMAALALFNWGNVHMSRARKQVSFPENASRETITELIKAGYDWAKKEYKKAEGRYEEAVKIKPDFYEGYLALGQQQFDQAKLCWYYAIGSKNELETEPSSEVLQLYNKAEDSMDRGMLMWEEMEERRLNGLSKEEKYNTQLQKLGLDGLIQEVSADEAAEHAANMKSQIYLLWGTLLYERSVVEYKLGLPTWEECLEVSVEKFELCGASPTDIAVMIKNHCSNETALEGLGFKIDEIIQAWNEMYDAKRWQFGVPSFRLEPLLRRQVPKLHSILEHA